MLFVCCRFVICLLFVVCFLFACIFWLVLISNVVEAVGATTGHGGCLLLPGCHKKTGPASA